MNLWSNQLSTMSTMPTWWLAACDWLISTREFVNECSMNESRIWMSLSIFACKSMLNWLNWTLNQLSKHRWLKLLDLPLAHQLLDSRHQFLHERNSENWILTLFRKNCLRKNFASNVRSQNIEHMTVLKRLKCTRSLRIWKMICLCQSSDWKQYIYILFHQHVWWFI